MLSVKPWRPLAVFQYCAALIFCFCLGGLLSLLLEQFRVPGFQNPDGFGHLLIGTFSFQGMACLLALVFFRHYQLDWRAGFGLSGPSPKRALRVALWAFLIVLPSVWILQATSVLTLTRLGFEPKDQKAIQLLDQAQSWWVRGYLAGWAISLAPIAEEFIFRGLLYPLIKQLGWPRLALFGVSFLFALIHLDLATFLPLFLMALALTWIYERTDNLLAPILVHALFNAANLAMLVLRHRYGWDETS